ncbi:hypothetical protein OGAPHI_003775 [Ogataea philodendri]|uniref:Uncharacterized protein n=1 Tax=Ogataea philodendri TaxID=1378263 RepID=A0A9P8P4D0_9ASCO|nr:uncharacterized protein OGAPHI_003775 [Ogataea philodendri]KAH3665588.1 hypothetical protein OGAPHI_003775 [Ogataea philodendri]
MAVSTVPGAKEIVRTLGSSSLTLAQKRFKAALDEPYADQPSTGLIEAPEETNRKFPPVSRTYGKVCATRSITENKFTSYNRLT